MVKEFFVTLATALPKFRNRFTITGLIIAVAGVIATRTIEPSAIHAQISAGALGVVFLVFGQLFHSIADFPQKERAKLVFRLFLLFVALVMGLVITTGYFLIKNKEGITIALEPPSAFDVRSNKLPLPTDRLQHDNLPAEEISASALRETEGKLVQQFVGIHYAGYPKIKREKPNYVIHQGREGIDFQTAGFVWDYNSAVGRFALVSHTGGPYVAEHIYLKLHRYADCSLRDERSEQQAPGGIYAYSLYVTPDYNVYELIPREEIGKRGNWRLVAQDADEFALTLKYPPYKLMIVSLVAEIRNETTGEGFLLRSKYYPLLGVANGNVGGCLELRRWYDPKLLKKPNPAAYYDAVGDLLTYQILTIDAENDRIFFSS